MTYTIPADKLPELIQAVRDLAAEYPDAVYFHDAAEVCSYSAGKAENGPDQCGCLIGQAMRLAGLPPVPSELDDRPVDDLTEGDTQEQRWWLRSVQRHQDIRCTWSKAVEAADELVNLPSTP